MNTDFGSLWQGLGIGDAARGLDLKETITHRTFEARRIRAEALLPAITIPALPHISVALPGSKPAATQEPRAVGPVQPDLEVAGVLGEGGMGRVLLAHQRSLRRDVAIKTVKPGIDDRCVLDALLTEAVVTGSLEHPSVVPVHALGCDDDQRPILVMKRIDGVPWKSLVKDEHHEAWSRLDPTGDDRLRAHLEIFMQVCNAIHFAHCRGFVHRDVKLDNVMIGEFGEVYVVDWGIAVRIERRSGDIDDAALDPGALVGTPVYMAPEMLSGDTAQVDARTDVYLLGATLHVVLTGEHRHKGEGLMDVLLAAHQSIPYSYGPEIPPELAAICNKATSANPADRFPTARAMRRAIADYLRHKGSIALSDAAAARLSEMRALLRSPGADPRNLHRLMTECRFGFMQALREWRENAAAREGVAACLEAMIEHELSLKNAEQASVLYAELPQPKPELAKRIEALAAELREIREHNDRLRRREREFDLSIGATARLVIAAVLVVCAAVFPIVALRTGVENLRPRDLVSFMAVLLIVLVAATALYRKRLLANLIGRQLAGMGILWASVCLAHRITAVMLDLPIMHEMILENWMTAGFMAIGGITILRHLWWVAIPFAASSILSVLRPDLAFPVYCFAGMAAGLIMAFFARKLVKS